MPSERCGARKRDGGNCTQWAVTGARRCRMHGGKTAAAAYRAETQKAEVLKGRLLGDVPDQHVDPVQALLELLSQKHAEIQWLRAVIRDVDPEGAQEGLVWGLASHEEGVGPEGPIDKRVHQARPSVWWDMLRKAEDQLAKLANDMVRNNLAKRQLELDESMAVVLAEVMRRIFDQLELDQRQSALLSEIVPKELRAMTNTKEAK